MLELRQWEKSAEVAGAILLSADIQCNGWFRDPA